jgi:predicted permease
MNPSWRRYLRFWGVRVDEDVDDELAFHIEMRARDYMDRGMTEDEAYAAARRRVGDLARTRAACRTIGHRRQRRMQRTQTIDALLQDARYALRTLARHRGWTIVALLTMALGIGASTAMFSVVNSTVLNPLPYRDADRVVMIWRVDPKTSVMVAPDEQMIEAWRSSSRLLEAIESYATEDVTMTGRGDPAKLGSARIRPTFPAFTGLGLRAGRSFAPEEAVANGPRVAIISERIWRQSYAGDPGAIGQHITLGDKPYTIIGIAAAALRGPLNESIPTDVWLPAIKDTSRFNGGVYVARLRRGATIDAATAELNRILEQAKLEHLLGTSKFVLRLVKPGDIIGFKTSLFLLSGAVALLLLVACANVAHLLLARSATRERELAIRAALGAGRGRLTRQLLTESLLLAIVGCVGGVIVAYGGIRALMAFRPASLVVLDAARLDGRALMVAILVSTTAGLLFGVTAALHTLRRTSAESLRASTTGGSAAARSHRLRSLLVVTEMAVSAMLLVGATLLVRSVSRLQHVDPGFDTRNLYSMSLQLPRDRYPSAAGRRQFVDRVVERARMIPGVESVSFAGATPPGIGGFMLAGLQVEGEAVQPPSAMMMNFVAPNFFSTLRLHVEGSAFTDASPARSEVIVSRAFARKHWPGASAVGHRIRFAGPKSKPEEGWMTVIGVAEDVQTGAMSDHFDALIYNPIDPKDGHSRLSVAVRTKPGIDPTISLRRIVTDLDLRFIPPPVSAVASDLANSIGPQRFTMLLLATFATLAVVLSAVGLYGVISFVVTLWSRVLGFGLALGASRWLVGRGIAARGLVLSTVGLAIGLTAAVWGTRLIRSALFGVTTTDPLSYVATGVLLLAISLLACLLPMRRAMRVDPVITMRAD